MGKQLFIKNARLRGRENLTDILINDSVFARIEPGIQVPNGAQVIDAAGKLVLPPFCDPHQHLDATLSVGNPRYNMSGTLLEGIQIWGERKLSLTKEVIKENAIKAIKWEVANGVLKMRTHADATDRSLLTVEALVEVREEMKDLVDLQIVAFPQDCVFTFPEAPQLMERAIKMGADVVGGLPYIEFSREDGVADVRFAFDLAEKYGRQQAVLFRITPEVSAGAHAHVTTGKRDSKFGVPIDDHIIYPLIGRAIHSPNILFKGLHFHIGSQIFDFSPYLEATKKALEVIGEIHRRFGYSVPELVVGGGFGIRYTGDEERKPYAWFMDPVMELINNFCADRGLSPPRVGIEPGRSIVGDAGVTLYTVGAVKQIPGGTLYVSIDGGMSDNIRPALYGAEYEAVIANKAGDIPSKKATVCGKLCESGDRIIEDVYLAGPERGDILCVFATGAYGYSMASNYNKLPKPAVVFVRGSEANLVVRRQTLGAMTEDEL